MPYDNSISRTDLSDALNRPEYINEIFQATVTSSAVMQVARRLPNMSRATSKMSVLDSLPTAYFVDSEGGLKKTTSQAWKGKTLTAEEIAAIVPIPENLLADVDISLDDIGSRIGEAMGVVIDNAVLQGTNLPASWLTITDPTATSRSILAGCANASHTVTFGTGLDIYDNVLGEDGLFSMVEADGYDVTGAMAPVITKSYLRHLRSDRDATSAGLPIFMRNDGGGGYTLAGLPVIFPRNGGVDPTEALLYVGDWSQLVYAMRQDITFKLITEGVITNGDGEIQFNLPQQDMVALRVVMRLGFQIANPVNLLNTNESTRYPFAALLPATGT